MIDMSSLNFLEPDFSPFTPTRGRRNNNPFNIKKSRSRWLGKVEGDDPVFETFESIEFGIRAGIKLLINYIRFYKLHTVGEIITRFAPCCENDTHSYLQFLSHVGLTSDVVIRYPSKEFASLCCQIMIYESSYKVTEDIIYSIIKQFKLY